LSQTHSLHSVRRLVLAALLAVTAGTACGGSGTPAPAGAPLDACRLFTLTEAEALAGEDVSFRSSVLDDAKGRDPSLCAFNSGGGGKVLSLQVRRLGTAAQARSLHTSTRGILRGSKPGDVAGVGEAAFWVGGPLQELHAVKGTDRLIVTLQLQDGKDHLAEARGIATRAFERLAAAP
jgi:hypothetical protein